MYRLPADRFVVFVMFTPRLDRMAPIVWYRGFTQPCMCAVKSGGPSTSIAWSKSQGLIWPLEWFQVLFSLPVVEPGGGVLPSLVWICPLVQAGAKTDAARIAVMYPKRVMASSSETD